MKLTLTNDDTFDGAQLHRPQWAGGGVFNQGDWEAFASAVGADYPVTFNSPGGVPEVGNTTTLVGHILKVAW